MDIYEFFAAYTRLPVRLRDVRDFILERGIVSRIERYKVDIDTSILQGGMNLYHEIAPPYVQPPLIARIAYPKDASVGVRRLVQVKEMLHILDPVEARSQDRESVSRFISDLLIKEAGLIAGLPALYDHAGIINALRILMPSGVLDEIRTPYESGLISIEQIAEEAKIPPVYVAVCLDPRWNDLA